MFKEVSKELLSFIEKSYSNFHVIYNMKEELNQHGFTELLEGEKWNLKEGGKYYVSRNETSLIAFQIPKKEFAGFQIMASHSDFPTFKLKRECRNECGKSIYKAECRKIWRNALCAMV